MNGLNLKLGAVGAVEPILSLIILALSSGLAALVFKDGIEQRRHIRQSMTEYRLDSACKILNEFAIGSSLRDEVTPLLSESAHLVSDEQLETIREVLALKYSCTYPEGMRTVRATHWKTKETVELKLSRKEAKAFCEKLQFMIDQCSLRPVLELFEVIRF